MHEDSEAIDGSAPVVMKFGGSSVANPEKIRQVADRVVRAARQRPVVVVVSAMGSTTDDLVALAQELARDADPDPRELDMLLSTGERSSMALLALAIRAAGRSAVSLTGSQCGIITDHRHGHARIVDVRPFRIQDELAAGHVVIVGGFQGVSYKREVTTLGRGGSDTTAVALAAALGGDCEIYSDVDGVYTTDPRVVPEARRLDAVDAGTMQALSRSGARVLHHRAVEIAEAEGIAIYARATAGSDAQTVIRKTATREGGRFIAVAADDILGIDVRFAEPVGPSLLDELARSLVPLGLQRLKIDRHGFEGWIRRRQRDDVDTITAAVGELLGLLGEASPDADVRLDDDLAVVSGVGRDLEDRPELARAALDAVSSVGVPVLGLRTAPHTVALTVRRDHTETALKALHRLVEHPSGGSTGAAESS